MIRRLAKRVEGHGKRRKIVEMVPKGKQEAEEWKHNI
jgi:DNA-binding PadR family transcriptional regulator